MPEICPRPLENMPEMRPRCAPRTTRDCSVRRSQHRPRRYARGTPEIRPESGPRLLRTGYPRRRGGTAPRRDAGGAGAGGGPRARTRRRRTPANDRAGGGVRLDKTQKAKGRIFSPQNTSHGNVKVHTPESVPSDTFSDTFSRAWMLGPKTQNTTIRRNSERGLPTSLTSI
jgi:hypothetical protein